MPATDKNAKLLADIDTKVSELKTAIHEANATLKDLRAERKELKAHLSWAMEEHQKLLAEMVGKSSAEVLSATAAVMENVAHRLTEIVTRTQSVQTLVRVDRLLRFVETQLAEGDGPPKEGTPGDVEPDGS